MAKDKKLVEQITSMEEDFAQWYTDVVKAAKLADKVVVVSPCTKTISGLTSFITVFNSSNTFAVIEVNV